MQDNRYEKEKADKRNILKKRAIKVKQVVSQEKYSDYFTPYPFNSGYFMCVRLREGLDSEQFRKRLLEDEGIGVISIDSTDIRIAFSSVEEEDIEKLFSTMLNCAVNMNQSL